MGPDGVVADHEVPSQLGVGQALGNKRQNLCLPAGELVQR